MSVGCASLPPLERQQLMDASRQYSAGDTASATGTLDRIIRDYGQTAEIAEAYYIRGLCRFKARQTKAAAEDFERGISKSKRADLTARCRASLAAIEFEKGDWKSAADLYGQAVGGLPDVAPTDAVLLEAGIAMQRAGKWRDADTQFARILHRFRNRPVAADARRMSLWRHSYYSIQYGAYRDAENAGKAVQALRRQGLNPTKEYLPRDGQPLWIVMDGQYRTYDETRAAIARIRKHQPQATIAP
jgi:tetratricopeptide (TPR) repeat protein